MPNLDPPATILEEVLAEADALIRRRLQERALEVPHLVGIIGSGFELQT